MLGMQYMQLMARTVCYILTLYSQVGSFNLYYILYHVIGVMDIFVFVPPAGDVALLETFKFLCNASKNVFHGM